MNAIVFLLPLALAMGATFAVLFLGAVRDGQFDDLDDPPERILRSDEIDSHCSAQIPTLSTGSCGRSLGTARFSRSAGARERIGGESAARAGRGESVANQDDQ